jgi:predicted nucleic acid-binding Zn finger protein
MITQEQLKELGFEFLEMDGDKKVFLNESKNNRDERIYIGKNNYVVVENNCGIFYFMGWLKTKKELKRILKQVGVEYSIINL